MRGDQVDVETDLAADANEGGPSADEDRRLEVMTELVNQGADDTALVFVDVRHWFAAPNPRPRTAWPSTHG